MATFGPALVQTENIVDGAITSAKLASGAVRWTGAEFTGKPLWFSRAILFLGVDAVNGGYLSQGSPVSGTWYDPLTWTGDSAAVAIDSGFAFYLGRSGMSNPDWSKIATLASAYYHCIILSSAGTVTGVDSRLYNQTDGAAVTGSSLSQANPVSGQRYELVSGSISANLPTANNKEVRPQLMSTNTVAPATIRLALAEILFYWS